MTEALDGLLTFFASHHAIRAEKTLRTAGLTVLLVPGPKELSPNCGTAVRFEHARAEEALTLLAKKKVKVDEVHEYRPATAGWQRPPRRESGRRLFRRKGQP